MPSLAWFIHGCRRALSDSRLFSVWIAAGFLFLLSLRDPCASAQTRAAAPGSNRPDASPAAGAPISVEELAHRLERLEQQNAKLAEQNHSLVKQLEAVTSRYDQLNQRLEQIEPRPGLPTPALPAPLPPALVAFPDAARQLQTDQPPFQGSGPESPFTSGETRDTPDLPETALPSAEPARPAFSKFLVGGYDEDRGMFVLVRPSDAQRVPFELRVDLFTQARYTSFARSADSWIDSTGTRQPIRNFASGEVMRNFIQFSGFGLDPRLQFTAFIFSSTALNDTVYLGWINYRFSDALDLRVGNWLVPGTREWNDSFRYTLGADRLMATTFFRPNISPGIWAQGEPIKNVHYVAMLANSLNRFSQGVERVGLAPTFGGTVWWEPRGDFGPGPSDIENHQSPSPRIGTNLALSHEANQGFGINVAGLANPEDTILRLSNGTPLFRPGALGPGVELISTGVQLWTIDAAVKYRGLGISGEYFLRWLDGFKETGGGSPYRTIFDQGGLLQTGYFVAPGKLETFARTSFVTGPFGGGNEFGGGVNWYVKGSRDWRLTFEVLRINHSPAQNILTGYRAGESGTLFQLQWFTDF
jgi:hypothetical protein